MVSVVGCRNGFFLDLDTPSAGATSQAELAASFDTQLRLTSIASATTRSKRFFDEEVGDDVDLN